MVELAVGQYESLNGIYYRRGRPDYGRGELYCYYCEVVFAPFSVRADGDKQVRCPFCRGALRWKPWRKAKSKLKARQT